MPSFSLSPFLKDPRTLSIPPALKDPRTLLPLSLTTFLSTLLFLGYRDWHALGPGAPAYSFRGFLSALYAHLTLGRLDTLSTKIYSQPPKSAPGWAEASEDERREIRKSYLPSTGGLEERKGRRSRARFWAIPQREWDLGKYGEGGEDVREAYALAWHRVAEEYGDELEWRTSELELRGQGLFLKGAEPPVVAVKSRGEVGHIHSTDSSGHVTLSFADAEEVVRKGWGEQHRFSGTILPIGYTFLYVPRTMEEIRVFETILRASIDYMLTGKKVSK